jgi:ADP-ribosylglycohydrolase
LIRITWLKPEERVAHEFRQLREQGLDPSGLEAEWASTPEANRRSVAPTLLDRARALSDAQPSPDIEGFLQGLERPSPTLLDDTFLYDRILGSWTGRMAGCLLGKPVEKVPREGIRALLESIGEWPLRQYFTAEGVPASVTERYPWNRASRPTSLRETIVCMPEDDDINFMMLGLHLLEAHGTAFTTDDVATAWLQMMPALTVFTAERVAYYNLLSYLTPPETARHHNPYREWIGAQIRADIWGLVAPGDAVSAADLAWRDARLSHTENGVYGAMFVAGMVAASFTASDVREVVARGLEVIPENSRLAEALRFAASLPERTGAWETALDLLYARYGHYHWVHTINNAALVAAALLFGEGDYERTITYAVMGGWDTDCNGATAGSVIGSLFGRGAIPEAWAAPLGNRVRSSLKGFDDSAIDALARRTLAVMPPAYRRTPHGG